MKFRKIGCSSLNSSSLGIGALHFGHFLDQDNTANLLSAASDLGLNFIDTAPMYGNGRSESYIGKAIKGRRDKFLLATKVGLEPATAPDGTFGVRVASLTEDYIRSGIEDSLRNLGTDYIDLYQLHAFDQTTPMDEVLTTLEALVKEGKIRYTGCSNYSEEDLRVYTKVASKNRSAQFASFQVHYNMIERRAEEKLLPSCSDLGMGGICNRALARGILTGKYKLNQELPEGSRAENSFRIRRWLSDKTLLLTEALEKYANQHGRSLTELSIAWLLKNPNVAVVLVGVRNVDQLKVCANAVEWELSDSDMIEIDEIIGKLDLEKQVKSLPETFFET